MALTKQVCATTKVNFTLHFANHLHVNYIQGRGPLAGPVVTAACYITNDVFIEGIKDSKQTKEEEREEMYEILIKHPDVYWAATVVSHTEIDEVNILQATMNGMRRSTVDLLKKLEKQKVKGSYIALVDGNRVPTEMPIESQYVIKGDGSIFSIAAASIIAKVTRDRIMVELDKEFPQYNLAQHKGYPTFEHRSLLMKHGPCRIHRTSYAPVKLALQAQEQRLARAPVLAAEEPDSGIVTTGKRKRVTKVAVVESAPAPAQAKRARGVPEKAPEEEKEEVIDTAVVKGKKSSAKKSVSKISGVKVTTKKTTVQKTNSGKARKSSKVVGEVAIEKAAATKRVNWNSKVESTLPEPASARNEPEAERKAAAKSTRKADTKAETKVKAGNAAAPVVTGNGSSKRTTRASSR